MDDRTKVKLIIGKMKPYFNDCPESMLMFGIIEQALRDLTVSGLPLEDRLSAIHYLKRNMVHAEICGIDSAWIRRLIRQVGLKLSHIRDNAILQEAHRLKVA